MAKFNLKYSSFNSGELSDLLRGRSDLEQYFKGGLQFKNLLALQYGPFLYRPGSMYSANVKTDSTATRLLEFVFNPSDAFIIEMGNLYFRFFTSSGQVAGPLEVVSTYTTAELFEVQYAQSNDVITLVHGSHMPAKLTRVSASSWTLADYDFKGTPYLNDNTDSTALLANDTTTKGASGTLTATGGHTPFTSDHVGSFWKIGSPTGTPEVQGYVKITGFTSTTVVSTEVIETLDSTTASSIWAEGAWSDERGWPERVAYHENKLWFAKTATEPNGIWGSKPFIYDNFDPGTGLDDDGISEKIPDSSDIRWISGGTSLFVGTDKGEYTASSGDVAALTPSSISFSRQTGWESEDIQPKIIGSFIYPIQAKGRKVREVFYHRDQRSYKSADTTAIAEHITESGIVDVAYQRNPYSMMYCVLDNGKMAVMTRESDQEVLAWTILDTDGEYESVAVIPHPTENYDMVWTVVKRTINGSTERHVEYFVSPIIPDRQELCFYVDDGLTYNAYDANTGGTLTLSALTGTGITVTAGSSVFVSGNVDQRIRAIDTDTGEILGELKITGYTSGTEVTGDVVKDFDSLTYVANAWGKSVNDVSGFDHLEAKTIKLLVDGGIVDDKTVASGSITLADGVDGFIISGGLGYTGRWQNMPIEAGAQMGTAIGQKKRINRADYVFYRSVGMTAGSDTDHLDIIIRRDPATLMGQAEPYYTGVYAGTGFSSTYDYDGFFVIQQDNPLPLCVLSVIAHMQTNEV